MKVNGLDGEFYWLESLGEYMAILKEKNENIESCGQPLAYPCLAIPVDGSCGWFMRFVYSGEIIRATGGVP